jgi:hypothetical protein
MTLLVQQRCLHHPEREAVARCPECGRFFCHECVTEHEDRVICADCLPRLARREGKRRGWFADAGRLLLCAAGALLVWLYFFVIGRALLSLPDPFHKESLWEARSWEED